MIEYFEDNIDVIKRSLESIDAEIYNRLLEDCEKTLKSGHSIIVSGLGKNVPICEKFVGTMVSLGLKSNFLHTNSAVHGDIGMVRKGDLVIILTKSGQTSETVYLGDLLLERNAAIWLLSFQQQSAMTDKITNALLLNLDDEGDLWNIMPNNSTTINLIVLQGIAMELAKRMHVTLNEFKYNHPGGAIGQKLSTLGKY